MSNSISRDTFEGYSTESKLLTLFDLIMDLRSQVNRYAKIWGLLGGAIPTVCLLIFLLVKGLF